MLFWIEITATIFGFLCVLLTIFRNVWCWPTGLVQVLLFIIIFYNAKLYSDLGLHVIYVGLQFYGWYCWTRRPIPGQTAGLNANENLPVTSLSRPAFATWIGVTFIGTLGLGYTMTTYTDAAVPFGDAFTTVASLVATYLLANKKVESWIFWIAVDVLAIGIYYYKSLIPTSILYSAFLVLAIIGLIAWQKALQDQEPKQRSNALAKELAT